MKVVGNLALVFVILVFSSACTQDGSKRENSGFKTFESIEKGVSLETARASLDETFTEYNVGRQPKIDVMLLGDGRQLVFVDNVLTDKNRADDVDVAKNSREGSEKDL